MADSMEEKTEKPTPRRLQEARKKGTVARSMDLNGAIAIFAAILVLPSAISMIGQGWLVNFRAGFQQIPNGLSPNELGPYIVNRMLPVATGLALLMFTIMVVGVASNFAQVGFHLSGEALKPHFNRLNPASGFKRLLGSNGIVETIKASAKLGLFLLVAYQVIRGNIDQLTSLNMLPIGESILIVAGLLKTIATRIALIWLVLAGADYGFQKYRVTKELSMTKDEVKREMKEQETSQEVKIAQMKFRRKLMRGGFRKAVKEASVIVTNPTHYSVAIKYEAGKDHAPVVVAKGQDFIALKIREFAKEEGVPIVPNPPLARALYRQCEIGDHIPREYFQTVAEVLAYVYRTIKKIKV